MMIERGTAEQMAPIHAWRFLGIVVALDPVFGKDAIQSLEESRGGAISVTARRLAAV
jgi:hypothetical protein